MQTLFSSPIALAHHYWKILLEKGDSAIDATCGNGKDTLFLAQLLIDGWLFALDIQEKAIVETTRILKENLSGKQLERIFLYRQSHQDFPLTVFEQKIKLIVYNLGYLPGSGDKQLTTQTEVTVESVKKSLNLVCEKGVISITCYPGHREGKREETALLELTSSLDPSSWNICYHQWVNRSSAPSLFLIQKII